jgi:hypothetical protein
MTFIWPSHGLCTGETLLLRGKHQGFTWPSHGLHMGKTWLLGGKDMRNTWEAHEKTLKKSRAKNGLQATITGLLFYS